MYKGMIFGKQRKPTILIIEDQLNNHQLFIDAFEQAGLEATIRQTADGNFAGEVADLQPDVISMDLMIAKIGKEAERDGFEAIDLLKSDPRTSNIPIIVLTNFFEERNVEKAKELGALDYINLQGLSLPQIAKQFKQYVDSPKHYQPSHPIFRDEKS